MGETEGVCSRRDSRRHGGRQNGPGANPGPKVRKLCCLLADCLFLRCRPCGMLLRRLARVRVFCLVMSLSASSSFLRRTPTVGFHDKNSSGKELCRRAVSTRVDVKPLLISNGFDIHIIDADRVVTE